MKYREDKYGNKLSVLGFGCMRFKKKMGRINMEDAERQIMSAFHKGVNYFDTAFIYPGSEAAIGEIFEKNNIRNQVYIATKLPPQLMRSIDILDKLFNEQLKRLRTDHIDFYLMHMMADIKIWERLKSIGIEKWIEEKKASGAIRQVGFSYHGNSDMFCKIIDAYDWDMCLIQYNYMDEHTQAGRKGLNHANDKGIPVMIMEPLRGGRLVNNIPADAKRIFDEHSVQHTPAQWAFRWLWNQPEVSVVLSGMNSDEMVEDNIKTASETEIDELTANDEEMLKRVVRAINAKMKVPCTGCGYCMPCPQNINISGIFSAYNRCFTDNSFAGFREYVKNTTSGQYAPASKCVGCGKCEKHCPQSIDIRKQLKEAENELEGTAYKMIGNVLSVFKKNK
ncbi:MAG: aldo/keto reductase [Ruminococcaceae bacterium]|nr:aldo/keto reductase [Oscillospiraceae bacterium]